MRNTPDNVVQVVESSRLRSYEFRALFLELSAKTEAWLRQQLGFLRHELNETKSGWFDAMLWRDRKTADAGNAAFAKTDIAIAFAEIVAPD